MGIEEWDCTTYYETGDIRTFKGFFYKAVEALDGQSRPSVNINECPEVSDFNIDDHRILTRSVWDKKKPSRFWKRVNIKRNNKDAALHIDRGAIRSCTDVEVMEYRRRQGRKAFKAVERLSDSLWGVA